MRRRVRKHERQVIRSENKKNKQKETKRKGDNIEPVRIETEKQVQRPPKKLPIDKLFSN